MKFLFAVSLFLVAASAHAFNFDVTSYAGRHQYTSNEPDNRCQGFIETSDYVGVICNSKTHETQPVIHYQPLPAIGEPADYTIIVSYLNSGPDMTIVFQNCYVTRLDYDHVTATCQSSSDDGFTNSFECYNLGIGGCDSRPIWLE